jgi:hypothetical protein
VGAGWQGEEYEAAGLDFDRRGQLLDHTLAVCQTLWRDPAAGSTPRSWTSNRSTAWPSQAGQPGVRRSGAAAPSTLSRRRRRFKSARGYVDGRSLCLRTGIAFAFIPGAEPPEPPRAGWGRLAASPDPGPTRVGLRLPFSA